MSLAAEHFGRETRDTSRTSLTGRERKLGEEELIVSKTDPRGILTYVNKKFLDISDYTEAEVMGKPHSIIRHPHMPRCVFKLLWDTIKDGKEIFAYVVNRCKNGDHYWVLAHVTPSFTASGQLVGFHSSRRAPSRAALAVIEPLYRQLQKEEESLGGGTGLDASIRTLNGLLAQKGLTYDQFILTL
jgi:PAS domain S-box-containing protein